MSRKAWSASFGEYGGKGKAGSRVRVYEAPSGILYAEERAGGKSHRHTLKHRDRARAKEWARHRQAELELALAHVAENKPTVARLFAAYLDAVTQDKAEATQESDRRAAELWGRVLGAERDCSMLSDTDLRTYMRRRRAGELDARGHVVVKEADRRKVGDRTVRADLEALRALLRWASAPTTKDPEGRRYLRENPLGGMKLPVEKNPRRPVATTDRYEQLRAVSDQVTMERWDGGRSYLSELLDLVYGTGRRISAILALRYSDLLLERGEYGAIRWRADSDKMGREGIALIARAVRAAVDRVLRERPGLGDAWLFPSPKSHLVPVSKDLASAWLERAEKLAKLEKMDGSLWHAFRRGWATARKHLPPQDVAASGGWRDLKTMQTVYQQVDDANALRVVMEPVELRERPAERR